MKICRVCNRNKQEKRFYKDRSTNDSLTRECKSCRKKMENRPKEYFRNHRLQKLFGITLKDYDKISKRQKRVCAICKLEERETYKTSPKVLAVDHCHKTGKVRGLLCRKCNVGIGNFKDNILLLKSAISYLQRS